MVREEAEKGKQQPDRQPERRKTMDMVDRDTREIHLLPRDATRDPFSGRCTALCGCWVPPTSMVDPGLRYCARCQEAATIHQLKVTTRPRPKEHR